MIASVHYSSVEPLKQTRGGRMLTLLSPKATGNTAGYVGMLTLAPGEVFLKHFHPYSEECFFVTKGEVLVEGDDHSLVACEGTAVFVPKYEPHRLRNLGTEEVTLVFFCSPLAPSPTEGHVMLEEVAPVSLEV